MRAPTPAPYPRALGDGADSGPELRPRLTGASPSRHTERPHHDRDAPQPLLRRSPRDRGLRRRHSSRLDSPPLGGVVEHALRGADADRPHHRYASGAEAGRGGTRCRPQDHDLRHHSSRRRAIAGHRAAAAREGRDRGAARAARRRRDRGGLRDLLARRLRGGPGRRARAVQQRRSPRSPATSRETSTPPSRRSPARTRSRLHVFIATSPLHMEREAPARARGSPRAGARASAYAAGRVDEVEFSAEDATRSDPRVPGTRLPRGRSRPGRRRSTCRTRSATRSRPSTRHSCAEVRRGAPSSTRSTLSVHCHDDLGLAVANTLAGVAGRRAARSSAR